MRWRIVGEGREDLRLNPLPDQFEIEKLVQKHLW